MEKTYRNYDEFEMRDLVGQIVMDKGNPRMVLEFDIHPRARLKIGTVWYDADGLQRYFIKKDGSLLKNLVEVTADGHTIEEFLIAVKGDWSKVEFYHSPLEGKSYWRDTLLECEDDLLPSVYVHGLDKYRLKKITYIRPKKGFRGSVIGVVDGNEGPLDFECVAVSNDEDYPFVGFEIGTKKITSTDYHRFKTPMFSKDNLPQPGTRFHKSGSPGFFRFSHIDKNCNGFICEKGFTWVWDSTDWIDFEIVED